MNRSKVNFSRVTIIFLIVVFIEGCSLLKKGEIQQKMALKADSHWYPLTSQELKHKLFLALDSKMQFEGPLMVSSESSEDFRRDEQVRDAFNEKGFFYKNKLYIPEELNFDINDFLSDDVATALKDKLKTFMLKARYHIIEDKPDEVAIVEGSRIYRITSKGDQSHIRVGKLSEVVREKSEASLDWLKLLKKQISFFSQKGPVNLEKSLEFERPDLFAQLELIYLIDPKTAEQWESEIMSGIR